MRQTIRKALRWAAAALAVVAAAAIIRPLLPMNHTQQERNRVMVEERHCYALECNSRTVLYVQDIEGDWTDVPVALHSDSAVCHIDTLEGRWANRWAVVPSCRGRVLIANTATTTDSLLRSANANLRSIIDRQRQLVALREARLAGMCRELDYYLEANNVTDDGYNTIATYATHIVARRRGMQRLLQVIDSLRPTDTLRLRRVTHHALLVPREMLTRGYSAFVKKGGQTDSLVRLSCHADGSADARKAVRRLQTDSRRTPRGAFAHFFARPSLPYPTYTDYQLRHPLPAETYLGETANGLRQGHGILYDRQGNYYNGLWSEGKREGFGCSVDSTGRVRVGEWKADRYLGERMHYTQARIYGIDISRYQHDIGKHRYAIDWPRVRINHLGTISNKRVSGAVDYPVTFCFIKATEGTTIQNKYFAADYAAARRQGIHVGCYHFFSTKSSATEQAAHFLRHARLQGGDLPPVLDVEPSDAQIRQMGGPEALFRSIRAWMRAVEQRCGRKPILYVGQNFVNKYLSEAPDIKRDYQVWIARYGEYKPDVRLAFWQLCPDGRVSGIHGTVDINVFNGYRDQFDDFLRDNALPH